MSAERMLLLGGSSDIGLAVAAKAGTRNISVALQGRDAGRLAAAAKAAGEQATVHAFDLDDVEIFDAALRELAEGAGRFNHLVVLTGYHRLVPLGRGFDQEVDRHLQMNLSVALKVTRAFTSSKVSDDRRQRSITFCASIAHRVGEPGLTAYAAAKGGLVAAARSLAVELARRNVRVNTVSPGWLSGRRTQEVERRLDDEARREIHSRYPLGVGTPEDVANAILFLCSAEARWITGIDLVVDGGRSCL